MEDIEALKMFFAFQTLLAIIILGIIITTIIKAKHEIKNTWIFKMMIAVEFFMVLMLINIIAFNIGVVYHMGAILAVIMMITAFYLFKRDHGQITRLSHKIK